MTGDLNQAAAELRAYGGSERGHPPHTRQGAQKALVCGPGLHVTEALTSWRGLLQKLWPTQSS